MSKDIAAVLREAALGPAPNNIDCLCSWVDGMVYNAMHTYLSALDSDDDKLGLLSGLTEFECRMFLLFCSYAAEDEE
jgi:hypothetical protein